MVESKRKNLALANAKNNNNTVEISSNINFNSEFCGEDDWIIVKKQRINIVIPRLPNNELSMEPNTQQDQLHGTSSTTINTPNFPKNRPPELQVAEINNGSICCSPILNNQSNAEEITKPRKPELRNPIAFPRKTKCPPKFSKHIRTSIQSGPLGVCNFSCSTMNVTNKIRALNLERSILSAGGLSRWLSSLGLERFERLFNGKNVGKCYLVNLSMKKLKDMGVYAVGPRRKLIHAIESGIQPYYHIPSTNRIN